jgi:acyl carrier protein
MTGAQTAVNGNYQRIVQAICTELDKHNADQIRLDESTDITGDLNIDSVAVMDLMFALEEEFDVSVPLNTLSEIRTIGDLATTIDKMTRGEKV